MSILEEVLLEEYDRSQRLCQAIRIEYDSLPKGSIRARVIRGHEYFYLNYRVGNKVKSDYVPASEVEELKRKIQRRRELKIALDEQERSQLQIKRALGKDFDAN